jgi:tetratricopeptide (TPR) repeat protein
MSAEREKEKPPPPGHSRRRRRLVLVLLLVVALAALGGPHAWAWYHLRAASADLEAYHPARARDHLARCLRVWPRSEQAHLLTSRAARQEADFREADDHLRACQRLHGGSSEEIALEWALLQAAEGNLGEVEEYLNRQAEYHPERAPLVWEAVAQGYIRVYRILDALACLELWLTLDPDNLRALELRGIAYANAHSASKGAEAFRRVLEQDPTRTATRRRLANCLLQMGSYDEALPHLEQLARLSPDDPEPRVGLARCHAMLGRPGQAQEILDEILQHDPKNALALRTRGQFALSDGQPAEAERWLSRAADLLPDDYQSQWLLFRALQAQEKKEAQAQLRKAEAAKQRAERLGELTSRQLSLRPLDPALHYEMGVQLLRSGNDEIGEGWLLSALRLDPDYRPAHQALADYYERRGDAERAREHRRLGRMKDEG